MKVDIVLMKAYRVDDMPFENDVLELSVDRDTYTFSIRDALQNLLNEYGIDKITKLTEDSGKDLSKVICDWEFAILCIGLSKKVYTTLLANDNTIENKDSVTLSLVSIDDNMKVKLSKFNMEVFNIKITQFDYSIEDNTNRIIIDDLAYDILNAKDKSMINSVSDKGDI
jgi:hypothetical protein